MSLNSFLGLIATLILAAIAISKIFQIRKNNKAIKNISTVIKNLKTTDRKVITSEINKLKNLCSEWAILNLADKYSWPGLVVSCLPKIYFTKSSKKITSIIWKEVINLIPESCQYEIIEKYCEGQVIKIVMTKDTHLVVHQIAIRLEEARLYNPYPSYTSLIGVINQFMNGYELEILGTDQDNIVESLQKERKELLREELNLTV